jgi:zinc/manganese transport system substrate-binding protein
VWYDLEVTNAVAERVAAELGELLPRQSDVFDRNAADFAERIDGLRHDVERVAEEHAGAKVVATEPIAHHLLAAAGLEDATPHEFAAAVENETDVPPAAQQQMLELVEDEVDVVVRNVQTTTPATENVVGAAEQAGTPVVDVTETLPERQTDYIAWMGGQIDALAKALDK